MKKEWILIVFSVFLTLITAFLLVRWFAPQLLGLPVDLQMVRVAKEVPPFFDGVFRPKDYESDKYLIPDPYIMRAKPFLPRFLQAGPNDMLGFRNRSIPNIADIITIGDSQTYGNNVLLEENWPSAMLQGMDPNISKLYNMSVGGWGATEYFEIFNKALYFQPKLIIVAFYTGNDSIDTFKKVYADERWSYLRLNPKISSSDVPSNTENSNWNVKFQDGSEFVFTPNLRYVSNRRDSPAVMVGYEIMGEIAKKMGEIANKTNLKLVFTIIPTKELVFKKKILQEKIKPREDYLAQVDDEEKNLMELSEKLTKIPGAAYVDLLEPLQNGILENIRLYTFDKDGHPLADGYKLIGDTLYKKGGNLLPKQLNGIFAIRNSIIDDKFRTILIKNDTFYFVASQILEGTGWNQKNIPIVDLREISTLSYGGKIRTADPSLLGPEASNN